ncbi:RNA-directed DNA polymerase [Actinotalea subterranea]|uniref:RNA-directed DNA polymerase n=1 Tax=Actinotalea subterranea TaxID=2607497 RepID=UPI00165E0F72|nr:RNA-directed DNA polymerase [Actinotalea subterranea]
MPLVSKSTFSKALLNIAEWGDTDIFPFPIDNHFMFDSTSDIAQLLESSVSDQDLALSQVELRHHSTLSPVGYVGFRWATQIEPYWNAYLLGLVLHLGDRIEGARVPRDQEAVYSYRLDPDSAGLFWAEGWRAFQDRGRVQAAAHRYVITADVSDFYQRIYHHRVENALHGVDPGHNVTRQVMEILKRLSENTSYGLPVGGPASRILSELTIDQIDRLMMSELPSGTYLRYADDFRIFVDDLPAAYRVIGSLSEKLFRNQGLSLQKSKTRIFTGEEYLSILDPVDPPEGSAARFQKLHLHFDPYSDTPEADYLELKQQMEEFDILDLLRAELAKGQVHAGLVKRLVRALKFLDAEPQERAILSLVDEGNFAKLAPVLPNVLAAIRDCLRDLPPAFRALIHQTLRARVEAGHPLTTIELNLHYVVRVLGEDHTPENERFLASLWDRPHGFSGRPSPGIQRDITLTFARWGLRYWLSNLKPVYAEQHPWVKRAFILASYELGDEGRHWRESRKHAFSPYDRLFSQWVAEKKQLRAWVIPI